MPFVEGEGWVGDPLSWWERPLWCKIGLHRWGAPWCLDCGAPDHILQESIRKAFEEINEEAKRLAVEEIMEEGGDVACKLCGEKTAVETAHLHQGGFVGECCWDERLRTTE